MPLRAHRHGAADTVEAGKHDAALARTGRGAPELDLKCPEQSLKLRQWHSPGKAAILNALAAAIRDNPASRLAAN